MPDFPPTTADPSYPIHDSILAFPEFGATINQKFLNGAEYRYSADFSFSPWFHWSPAKDYPPIRNLAVVVLLQTEPTTDSQMTKNAAPLHLSLSVLHIHNASLVLEADVSPERKTHGGSRARSQTQIIRE